MFVFTGDKIHYSTENVQTFSCFRLLNGQHVWVLERRAGHGICGWSLTPHCVSAMTGMSMHYRHHNKKNVPTRFRGARWRWTRTVGLEELAKRKKSACGRSDITFGSPCLHGSLAAVTVGHLFVCWHVLLHGRGTPPKETQPHFKELSEGMSQNKTHPQRKTDPMIEREPEETAHNRRQGGRKF